MTVNEFISFLKRNLEIETKITLLTSNNLNILIQNFQMLSHNERANIDELCHSLANNKAI